MKTPVELPFFGLARRGAQAAAGVNGAQAREHVLHPGRQALVDGVLVGEERVATRRRYLDGVQQAGHRRAVIERDVRVPDLGEGVLLAEVADRNDRWMAVEVRQDRVNVQLAPAFAEGDLLRGN